MSVQKVTAVLREHARPEELDGMARFGMDTAGRLGVSIPVLRRLAKELGKDHSLAQGLWNTGILDARILASMVEDPEKVTAAQMNRWVAGFTSWDVCDQVCMNLFWKTPFAWEKAAEWSRREEEFVKRAAFSLLACLAWHDEGAADSRFLRVLPLIRRAATDERNFVRKAVNWALRHIGKRNGALNRAAIAAAREIRKLDSKSARWIAGDALRELTSEGVRRRLHQA